MFAWFAYILLKGNRLTFAWENEMFHSLSQTWQVQIHSYMSTVMNISSEEICDT
jgi:hypothetical protein